CELAMAVTARGRWASSAVTAAGEAVVGSVTVSGEKVLGLAATDMGQAALAPMLRGLRPPSGGPPILGQQQFDYGAAIDTATTDQRSAGRQDFAAITITNLEQQTFPLRFAKPGPPLFGHPEVPNAILAATIDQRSQARQDSAA